ncbi:MAG: aminopeptidase P family protein [Prevotellaceae bacterium]|jgi:Xaa-Pro aminopeptidase|nr:aminopeptidase P family protein [Prevotellaceae bacterium]
MENTINNRVELLRCYLRDKRLHAFIIPSTDAHMSEYIPEHWAARQWISGFTGSAGTVVVTLDKAGLWTDSRYFLQAADELCGSEITLFKDRLPDTISIPDWLTSQLPSGARVGIDGNVYPAKDALALQSTLGEHGIALVPDFDPFGAIWRDRPALPKEPVSVLPLELAGEAVRQKVERTLAEAKKHGAEAVWVSTLDTIAWLFNLRGCDVLYNPVAVAHAFLSREQTLLFMDADKIAPAVAESLRSEGVAVTGYGEAAAFWAKTRGVRVCLDSGKLAFNLHKAIGEHNRVVDVLSVADMLKSMKNETEIAGFRRVMVRDGVALVKFLMWLEEEAPAGTLTEYDVCLKLKELRSRQENFVGESFHTIAGYAANGAINHYHPHATGSAAIKPEGLLLVDSGGQYLDGTTDITRTVAVGHLTDDMKRDYTLVLKGNINLSRAIFPAGTRGSQVDMLARKAMWEHGVNYLHGTGHGVGHFLNVHEGPHSIRAEENPVKLHVGMVATNEPGIYRDHRYGVRTENMMLTQRVMTTDFGDFYGFEILTLCPIDTTPVVKEMMTAEETAWLNAYHQAVYEKLSPHLQEAEVEWLKHKTTAL